MPQPGTSWPLEGSTNTAASAAEAPWRHDAQNKKGGRCHNGGAARRSSERRVMAQLTRAKASHHMHGMAHSCYDKNKNGAKTKEIRNDRTGAGIQRVSEFLRLWREQRQGFSSFECIWTGWSQVRATWHGANNWRSVRERNIGDRG